MGDQPEMDAFGAGGAGGHAPFGLPKGLWGQHHIGVVCHRSELCADDRASVSSPRLIFVPRLTGAKPLPYPITMSDSTYMVPNGEDITSWEPDAHMIG
jgi:hypothetical protein